MTILIITAGILLVVVLIFEGTHMSVFGGLLGERTLKMVLEVRLDSLELNPYSNTIMSDRDYTSERPYLSCLGQSMLTKWNIDGIGCVPRWSKWSRILDDKRLELLTK